MLAWLPDVKRVISPNMNDRSVPVDISLLVIHNISLPPGEFGGNAIEDFFCNRLDCTQHPFFESIQALKVSAHVLIKRNGDIVQFVPFTQRAWHAGVSVFEGRENCNDYSIGIELEGTDDIAYELPQYEALVRVTLDLMKAYPRITPERIVGHNVIAPERKTDPGDSFDWLYYKQRIQQCLNGLAE